MIFFAFLDELLSLMIAMLSDIVQPSSSSTFSTPESHDSITTVGVRSELGGHPDVHDGGAVRDRCSWPPRFIPRPSLRTAPSSASTWRSVPTRSSAPRCDRRRHAHRPAGGDRRRHHDRRRRTSSSARPAWAAPQDLSYRGEPTVLEVGDRNTIREFVTINRGTVKGGGGHAHRRRLPADGLLPRGARLRARGPRDPGQQRAARRPRARRRRAPASAAPRGAPLRHHRALRLRAAA